MGESVTLNTGTTNTLAATTGATVTFSGKLADGGGGSGTLRCWRDGESLVCEVKDSGHIQAPLIGRRRPQPEACSGRGVWLVNQLCDLVQIRSNPTGSVVRVHKRLT